MSKLIDAAQAARQAVRDYKALNELADVLENVGQLEQTENEIKARIESLKMDENAAKAQLAKVKQTVKEAEERAEAVKAEGVTTRNELIADAKAEAEQVKAKAKAKAAKLEAAAEDKLKAVEADIARKQALADEALTQARHQTNMAIADKAVVDRELSEVKAKLEQVKGQLASVLNM